MLGEKITVLYRLSAGEDDLGEPIFEWTAVDVHGALVRPLSGSDIDDAKRPDGIRVEYSIAMPKSCPSIPWAHARVALVDRGMDADDIEGALRVVGSPDIVTPCPTKWNMIVEVGRVDG